MQLFCFPGEIHKCNIMAMVIIDKSNMSVVMTILLWVRYSIVMIVMIVTYIYIFTDSMSINTMSVYSRGNLVSQN